MKSKKQLAEFRKETRSTFCANKSRGECNKIYRSIGQFAEQQEKKQEKASDQRALRNSLSALDSCPSGDGRRAKPCPDPVRRPEVPVIPKGYKQSFDQRPGSPVARNRHFYKGKKDLNTLEELREDAGGLDCVREQVARDARILKRSKPSDGRGEALWVNSPLPKDLQRSSPTAARRRSPRRSDIETKEQVVGSQRSEQSAGSLRTTSQGLLQTGSSATGSERSVRSSTTTALESRGSALPSWSDEQRNAPSAAQSQRWPSSNRPLPLSEQSVPQPVVSTRTEQVIGQAPPVPAQRTLVLAGSPIQITPQDGDLSEASQQLLRQIVQRGRPQQVEIEDVIEAVPVEAVAVQENNDQEQAAWSVIRGWQELAKQLTDQLGLTLTQVQLEELAHQLGPYYDLDASAQHEAIKQDLAAAEEQLNQARQAFANLQADRLLAHLHSIAPEIV